MKRVYLALVLLVNAALLSLSSAIVTSPSAAMSQGEPSLIPPQPSAEEAADWLTLLAADQRISRTEAEARFGWQNAFGELAEVTRSQFPQTFASAQVRADGTPSITFRGSVPSGAEVLTKQFAPKISLEGGARFSERELSDLTPEIHEEARLVLRASGLDEQIPVATEYDAEANIVSIFIGSDGVAEQIVRSIETQGFAIANARWGDRSPQVRVVVGSRHSSGSDYVRGGASITGCTSGWPVYDKLSAKEGIIIAEHCDGHILYMGRDILTRERAMAKVHGDIEFRSATEDPHWSFYINASENWRAITGHRSPYLGETLCRYGKTTQYQCSTVYSFNNCRGDYCNLVNMATDEADGGDSGGPWFNGNTAIGVHSGYSCGGACRDQFTPTRNNISDNLNVGIFIP